MKLHTERLVLNGLRSSTHSPPQLWGVVRAGEDDITRTDMDCSGAAVQTYHDDTCGNCAALVGQVWPIDDTYASGAALILETYRRHGDELINHCEGQFAAAVSNPQANRTVLCASWPGGQHSLYYLVSEEGLFFSNRIDRLLSISRRSPVVNERAIVTLFRDGGMWSDETLFDNVYRVVPGCAVVYESGHLSKRWVWRFPSEFGHDPHDPAEFLDLFSDVLKQQTSGMSRVGVFLSGGLDSSMNVAALAEHTPNPIHTFSVQFPHSGFDESYWSRLVAEKYDTCHHELCLDTADCLEALPRMVWAMEEPMIDYSFIPTFLLAEVIRNEIDVAIASDGPDHLMGRRYMIAAWRKLIRSAPGAARLSQWLLGAKRPAMCLRDNLWDRLRRTSLGLRAWLALASAEGTPKTAIVNTFRHTLWHTFSPVAYRRLLSEDVLQRIAEDDACQADDLQSFNTLPSVFDRIIAADLSISGMGGVFAKVGKMCAANGLSVREPFLTQAMIKYTLSLTDAWKLQGSAAERLFKKVPVARTKVILRRAAQGRVPSPVLTKPKQGFEPPLAAWFRDFIGDTHAKSLFPSLTKHTDWFNVSFLERLLCEHQEGKVDHHYLLILLGGLDQWYRIYMEAEPTAPTWHWSQCFR